MLNKLIDKFNRLNLTKEKLLKLIKVNEYETEFTSVEADIVLYLGFKVKMEYRIEAHRSKVVCQDSSLQSDIEKADKIKCTPPKMELQKFSGDARELLDL